jgi:hypothetical protein
MWREGQESQGFNASNGAGPYTLTDDYIEASGENVMFGGDTSESPDYIPSDILIDGCHFFKPLTWKGTGIVIKNLFELKQAKRAVIRNTLFENNWGGQGQPGYGIVFTPRNDSGLSPWACVEDVLFERNTVVSERGFNVLGWDSYQPSGQLTRVVIRDNDIQCGARVLQAGGEIGDFTFVNNRSTNTEVLLYEGDVWRAGESAVARASRAIQKFTFYGNSATRLSFDGSIPGRDNLATMVGQFITSAEPPPPPPPDDDIIGPDVRIAVLHQVGKSGKWEVRAESSAPDIVKVDFYVNSRLKQSLANSPYATQVSLKGYRGDVTVLVKAFDKAGNIGTASRTVVIP